METVWERPGWNAVTPLARKRFCANGRTGTRNGEWV